ncbi:MAG: hypothetical protein AB7U98_03760 [Candidatus Nitrosocosmicus sp.]
MESMYPVSTDDGGTWYLSTSLQVLKRRSPYPVRSGEKSDRERTMQ